MNLHDKLHILRELFDSDRLIEVISTLGKNKSRTMLTAFGIFWGIFMLILLLGGGMGLEKLLMNNFSGFSSNAAIIVPQTTALPYKGYDKGRDWHLAMGDVLGMKHYLSEAENITPVCINYVTGKNGKHTSSITLKGIEPDYLKIEEQKIVRTHTQRQRHQDGPQSMRDRQERMDPALPRRQQSLRQIYRGRRSVL